VPVPLHLKSRIKIFKKEKINDAQQLRTPKEEVCQWWDGREKAHDEIS
jgi:hypothetical protein